MEELTIIVDLRIKSQAVYSFDSEWIPKTTLGVHFNRGKEGTLFSFSEVSGGTTKQIDSASLHVS